MQPSLLAIIIPGVILPLLWMRRLQRTDRLISRRFYFSGIVAHLLTCSCVFFYADYVAIYCASLLILIALSRIRAFQSETHQRIRIAKTTIARLQSQLEHHADQSTIHFALGNAYYENRQYEKAIAEYIIAIKLDRNLQHAVKGKIKNARYAQAEFQQNWFKRKRAKTAEDSSIASSSSST